MKKETWKDIVGHEGRYQISDLGRIKSLARFKKSCYGSKSKISEKILSSILYKKTGYLMVTLRGGQRKDKSLSIHRLVAKHFIFNLENKSCVNHKDGIKSNNNVSNLEWVSYKENFAHAVKNNLSGDKWIDNMNK